MLGRSMDDKPKVFLAEGSKVFLDSRNLAAGKKKKTTQMRIGHVLAANTTAGNMLVAACLVVVKAFDELEMFSIAEDLLVLHAAVGYDNGDFFHKFMIQAVIPRIDEARNRLSETADLGASDLRMGPRAGDAEDSVSY